MNKVKPNKIEGVRKSLAQDKSYRKAMLENGYSEAKANQGVANKVIREALRENEVELKAKGMDATRVIDELIYGLETAKSKIEQFKVENKPKELKMFLDSFYSFIKTLADKLLATKYEDTTPFKPAPTFYNTVAVQQPQPVVSEPDRITEKKDQK